MKNTYNEYDSSYPMSDKLIELKLAQWGQEFRWAEDFRAYLTKDPNE
jgi:hypothetical protein